MRISILLGGAIGEISYQENEAENVLALDAPASASAWRHLLFAVGAAGIGISQGGREIMASKSLPTEAPAIAHHLAAPNIEVMPLRSASTHVAAAKWLRRVSLKIQQGACVRL